MNEIPCQEHVEKIPFREHMKILLDQKDKEIQRAYNELQIHLDNLNHSREESNKDKERYLWKDVYAVEHKMLMDRVDAMKEIYGERLLKMENSYSKLVGVGIALISVSFLIGLLLSHFLSKQN